MINLPEKFQRDIQSKSTFLVPLIVIDDRIFLSTSKVTLDGKNYDPLVESLGSISESIDIEKRKPRISSTSLKLFNSEYRNSTLSEKMFSPSVMNSELKIYIKSQSAQTLDDCLNIFNGNVVDIKGNNKRIDLTVEDISEEVLGIDLPKIYVDEEQGLPEQHNNKFIPFVYGVVNKAPCVYKGIFKFSKYYSDQYSISPDSWYLKNVSNPYVFADNEYMLINADSKASLTDTIYENPIELQYKIFPYSNEIHIDKTLATPDQILDTEIAPNMRGSLPSYNLVQVTHVGDVTFDKSYHVLRTRKVGEDSSEFNTFPINSFENWMVGAENKTKPPFVVRLSDNADVNTGAISYMMPLAADEDPDNDYYPILWGVNSEGRQLDQSFDWDGSHGECLLQFLSTPICSESKILTEADNINPDEQSVPVKGSARIEFSMYAWVAQHYNDGAFPKMHFIYDEKSNLMWDMHQESEGLSTGGAFHKIPQNDALHTHESHTGEIGVIGVSTSNIASNKFALSNRMRNSLNEGFINDNSGQGFIWDFTFEHIAFKRIFIMKDFTTYDIYADVLGRVDTIDGKYTSNREVRSLQERAFPSEGQRGVYKTSVTKPISKPVRKPIKKPIRKPIKKIIKTKTKAKY